MEEYETIISLYLDGEATQEQVDRLRQWLYEDERHRRVFAQQAMVHGRLRYPMFKLDVADIKSELDTNYGFELEVSTELPDLPALPPEDVNPRRQVDSRTTEQNDHAKAETVFKLGGFSVHRRESDRPQSGIRLSRLVAAVVLVGLAALFVIQSVYNQAGIVVARLDDTVGVEWDGDRPVIGQNGEIMRGPLSLRSGYAQIIMADGARLVVEGPADLVFLGPSHVQLDTGKLAARLPYESQFIEVTTPSSIITDLGTEFGVEVLANGESEIEVYDGSVQMRTDDPQGNTKQSLLVNADQACRANSAGWLARQDLPANSLDRFVRTMKDARNRPGIQGQIDLLRKAPPRISMNVLERRNRAYLIREREDIPINELRAHGVPLVSGPGENAKQATAPDHPPEDATVTSYLVHYDPADGTDVNQKVRFTLRFQQPIIGLIKTTGVLHQTDALFGHPETEYVYPDDVASPSRGLEFGDQYEPNMLDSVQLSADRKEITIVLSSLVHLQDQTRILVMNEPSEP